MTDEQFKECSECDYVCKYIRNQAKRRSKKPEDIEDYQQEAWACISTLIGCPGTDVCIELANKAIYSGYWQQNKLRLKMKGKYVSDMYRDRMFSKASGWKQIGEGSYIFEPPQREQFGDN